MIARSEGADDFVYVLPDGRVAAVHLTWQVESDPAFPATRLFESIEEFVAVHQRDG
ncbi:MAG: hypothetical protein AAF078_01355 [Planctomycetota bacterium]